MKYYTGVGSRKTPRDVLMLMRGVASVLKDKGFVLRSGGAAGADSAFEAGAGQSKEVFFAKDATAACMEIAKKYHPAWNRCGDFVKKLHGRNAFQVLGRDLKSPSNFVICWTPDGCTDHAGRSVRTGGTGTAISIASENGVPVFNLARQDHRKRIEAIVLNRT